ncbi:uncharacterized protein A4U43_C03F8670 [Asparagus officinalis]|uniref:Uncharacterized protein n=1 Tax=Asparagus officinalis TaxID=4686 RepID=A0A5P1F8J2_ASPOF|nr:uncharacterized protein A4U43_C03F8670 [Asparagus officinalis]
MRIPSSGLASHHQYGEHHDRATKMFTETAAHGVDVALLAKNKTLYIPTVSAVLRAVLYSSHPPTQPYKCSPDQEKMPLAVDSLVIQKTESSSSAVASSDFALGLWVYYVHVVVALFLCFGGTVVDVVA